MIRRLATGGIAVLALLSACSSSTDSSSGPATDLPASPRGAPAGAPAAIETTTSAAPELPAATVDTIAPTSTTERDQDAVTDEGVIEASVIILSDGDVDQAIEDGLVTEAEVDAALEAIANGTLGDYTSR